MGFKKDRAVNLLEEIIETAKEVIPEVKIEEEIETPENIENTEVKEETIVKIEKSEVKKTSKKKKRNSNKPHVNCGLKGDTIECRDFRAIVKKKGLQINIVLNGIIAEWNHNNYNL